MVHKKKMAKANGKTKQKHARKRSANVNNKAIHVSGRGAYTLGGVSTKGLLGNMGKSAGGFLGGPVGGWAGEKLGNWLGKITGMGAYHISNNSLLQGTVPSFGTDPGSVIVSHREFVGDVKSSILFSNIQYPLNPGMGTLFPWLSNMANMYEEYEMLGMLVEFKSTSADALNSTNTALGTMILATDYDCSDPGFTTKQQMEAYQYSTSCKPSESMLHPIECSRKQTVLSRLYVRSNVVPTGFDQRFYDLGVINLAAVGSQAVATVGELWVTYHVKFLKPKLPTPSGQNLIATHIIDSATTTGARGSATAAAPFGTAGAIVAPASTLPIVVTATNSFTVGFVGSYLLVFQAYGTGIAAVPTVTYGTSISTNAIPFYDVLFTPPGDASEALYHSSGGATRALFAGIFSVDRNNTSASIAIGGLTGMTAASTDTLIVQVPAWLGVPPNATVDEKVEHLQKMVAELMSSGYLSVKC